MLFPKPKVLSQANKTYVNGNPMSARSIKRNHLTRSPYQQLWLKLYLIAQKDGSERPQYTFMHSLLMKPQMFLIRIIYSVCDSLQLKIVNCTSLLLISNMQKRVLHVYLREDVVGSLSLQK